MRLVSCYITGFGGIKEYTYDFHQDFEAICQENGWGKTTFSVFLKAMFYGMEYTTKTKILPERKHYLPWDGSVCGGNLVFEVQGKVYRIERTFGKTNKDDTFALIDVETGKVSEDFSENIGEELFQVDRDSFEKSIFIPQDALATAMTDSLNAKMGDLAAAKDDINNFDQAVKRVDEIKKSYTRKSKVNNGKLSAIKDEISHYSEIADKKTAVLDGYEKQVALLEEKKKSLNWMEAEKGRIAEQIRFLSKKEQDMGAYRQKVEFLTKQQEELATLDDFFAKGIPSEEEQKEKEEFERQYDLGQRNLLEMDEKKPEKESIRRYEKLFIDGVPEKEELDIWVEKANRIQELQIEGKHAKLSEETEKQLEELKYFFSKKLPTEEELNEIEKDVVELSRIEGRLAELDEQYRNAKAKKNVMEETVKAGNSSAVTILHVVLCVALLAGGIAFHLLTPDNPSSIWLQVACFGGAIAILISLIIQLMKSKHSKNNLEVDAVRQLEEAENSLKMCQIEQKEMADKCNEFLSEFLLTPSESLQQMVYEIRVKLDRYVHLLEEERVATENTTGTVEELAEERMELYTKLSHYAEVYEMDLYHEGGEVSLLESLIADKEAFTLYDDLRKQTELLKVDLQEQEQELRAYCMCFPVESDLSFAEALKVIASNREQVVKLQSEVSELQEEIKQFKVEVHVEEDAVSVEELQQKQQKIDVEIHEMNEGITQDRDTIRQLSDELDLIEDAENKREVLLEQKAECERKVDLLDKTEKFLQQAREQFLSTYMKPLRTGMSHYLSLMEGEAEKAVDDMDFDITLDLAVLVRSKGTSHTSDYLSRGYQDLVALCARFALVDVLYAKEQPVIILDDPFTNLDDDKIKCGLKLLQEIAKERQIVYFTCHDSRMPR